MSIQRGFFLQAYFMDSEGRKMLAKNDRLSQYDPRIFGEKHVKKHLATWTLDEKWGSET
jgi:hypothetical protein